MSIDCRTRRHCDRTTLSRDQVFDSLIPRVLDRNADLAGHGLAFPQLPALSFNVEGRCITLYAQAGDTDAARALLADQRERLGPLAERKRVGLVEAEDYGLKNDQFYAD